MIFLQSIVKAYLNLTYRLSVKNSKEESKENHLNSVSWWCWELKKKRKINANKTATNNSFFKNLKSLASKNRYVRKRLTV